MDKKKQVNIRLTSDDIEMIDRIAHHYGHDSRSACVRYLVRTISRNLANDPDWVSTEDIAAQAAEFKRSRPPSRKRR